MGPFDTVLEWVVKVSRLILGPMRSGWQKMSVEAGTVGAVVELRSFMPLWHVVLNRSTIIFAQFYPQQSDQPVHKPSLRHILTLLQRHKPRAMLRKTMDK